MTRMAPLSTLAFIACAFVGAGCGTVRTIDDEKVAQSHQSAQRFSDADSLAYARCIDINAPAPTIFGLVADVDQWPKWNSTILSASGEAKPHATVKLVAKAAPGRTFKLRVTEFAPPRRMVWEDGMPMGMFSGVRTYTIDDTDSGASRFCMLEVFSGGMLGVIEGDLPDMRPAFDLFANDLKAAAEKSRSPVTPIAPDTAQTAPATAPPAESPQEGAADETEKDVGSASDAT